MTGSIEHIQDIPDTLIQTLLQTADEHTIISIADAEGKLTYTNDNFHSITGLNSRQLAGQENPIFATMNSSENLFKTILCGETWRETIRFRNFHGETLWLDCRVKPLLDDEANFKGHIAIYSDATAYQKYKDALRLLATIKANEWLFDKLANVVSVSLELSWVGIGMLHEKAAAIELLGLSKQGQSASPYHYHLPGTPCEQVIADKQAKIISENATTTYPDAAFLIDANASLYIGLPLIDADEKVIGIIWGLHSGTKKLSNLDDKLLRLACHRATMEIQRMEQANTIQRQIRGLKAVGQVSALMTKKQQEQDLVQATCTTLIQHGEFAMAWVDYIAPANDTGLETIAEAHDELFTFHYTDPATSIQTLLADKSTQTRAILGNSPIIEVKTTPPIAIADIGQVYDYSMIVLPLTIQGATLGVLCVIDKKVSQIQAEEIQPLRNLAINLTQGILHLRTSQEKQSVEKQLQQSRRMETIGKLTAGIAHDFNNILASILGYADLAKNRITKTDQNDDKLIKYIKNINKAGKRAKDLINQMLAFSKAKNDLTSDHKYIKPDTFVREIVEMLRATFPDHIQLSLEIKTTDAQIAIKPTELQQIVVNLAINARDAIGGQPGNCDVRIYENKLSSQLTCESCHQTFSGQLLVLEVEDNGAGIDNETLPHIFETFFTTKNEDVGTGLGLFNIHAIVHTRGGHIEVNSREGIGSVFRVYLPIVSSSSESMEKAGKPANIRELSALRILVVDDEASSAGFLQEWLKGFECDVTAFTDSLTAYQHLAFESQDYNVVIADYRMPGLDGLELLTEFLYQHPEHTAILLGSSADKQALDDSQLPIQYIEKPLNTAHLKALLEAIKTEQDKN